MSSILQNRRFRQLENGETVKSFNCGDAELNDFILKHADDYRKSLLAISYVLEDENMPIAYFSLSNDSLSYEKFENKSSFNRLNRNINNAKRMRQYPAVKIGRLAIDVGYKGVFTFESGSTLRPYRCWQGNRVEFGDDTRLREPKLFMQKHLEKLMYDMGEYILKSYDCFEE